MKIISKWINPKKVIEWMIFLIVFFLLWSHVNVVVSNSMYPVMKRGDLVVVENAPWEFNPEDVEVGDIVIYDAHWPLGGNRITYVLQIDNKTLELYEGDNTRPVVHRVIDKINIEGNYYIITKGDDNPTYDPELIPLDQIKKRVVTVNEKPLVIPYVGYISIYLKKYIWIVLPLIVLWVVYDYVIKYIKEVKGWRTRKK
ncbi:MAG TPA: S26 family signal peptidase [Methanococcaceae archaeon]|uniref:S26 family signal peptidase n=1 Tax=Methanothermococcus okinawensis TaxID=155863 RepID=A0A832ZHV4_9EURY|nr:S26 family signal peptidase [Methanococcaceae archaeon]HIP91470.1 S26 family signal peptidase [Methanothermococcus okinawensis]